MAVQYIRPNLTALECLTLVDRTNQYIVPKHRYQHNLRNIQQVHRQGGGGVEPDLVISSEYLQVFRPPI